MVPSNVEHDSELDAIRDRCRVFAYNSTGKLYMRGPGDWSGNSIGRAALVRSSRTRDAAETSDYHAPRKRRAAHNAVNCVETGIDNSKSGDDEG